MNVGETPPIPDGPRKLWNVDFFLLWQGQLVSQLGTQAAFLATMLWALEATGSPGLLSLLLVTSSLPGVVLGPLAGAVVDRHSRKTLLVAADAARGVAGLMVGYSLLRSASPDVVVSLLFVAAAVNGVAGAVFGPAVRAALPDLVPAVRLAAANGLTTMGGQAASLLGLAAGGALYAAVGPAALFIADGLSYLLSALSEMFIRLPVPAGRERGRPLGTVLAEYVQDTKDGLRFCLEDAGRRGFIVLAAGLNFLFMPIFVLLPLYVESALDGGAAWYGYLLAGLSGGSLLGLFAAGFLGDKPSRRSRALRVALPGTGLGMASLAWLTEPVVALAVLFGIGTLTGLINVLVFTVMQIRTPPAMRGRALAVLIALTGAASPLGLALGGLAGELAGDWLRWIVGSAGVAALLLACALLLRPSVRAFLDE